MQARAHVQAQAQTQMQAQAQAQAQTQAQTQAQMQVQKQAQPQPQSQPQPPPQVQGVRPTAFSAQRQPRPWQQRQSPLDQLHEVTHQPPATVHENWRQPLSVHNVHRSKESQSNLSHVNRSQAKSKSNRNPPRSQPLAGTSYQLPPNTQQRSPSSRLSTGSPNPLNIVHRGTQAADGSTMPTPEAADTIMTIAQSIPLPQTAESQAFESQAPTSFAPVQTVPKTNPVVPTSVGVSPPPFERPSLQRQVSSHAALKAPLRLEKGDPPP
jgi:hypothetical protein